MRRLIIAEKGSVAQAIADVLGVTGKGRNFIECGDTTLGYCDGHLFELPYPAYYNPELKRWSFATLPFFPPLVPLPKDTPRHHDRIKLLGQLIKKADEIVHAGDADNEGQLIVDTVIEHFKFNGPVLRFWTNAPDPGSVLAALQNLQDNRQFRGMRDAALARAEADYLIGMNLSRAFTLRAQAQGHQLGGPIPVGRVQTPALAMVVARDESIRVFRHTNYHLIDATVLHGHSSFSMRWQPEEDAAGCDPEGRLIDTGIANAIADRLTGMQGCITKVEIQDKTENHPKGLSLAGIGLLASKQFNFTAAQTLEICQALYEKYKLTTYPRTDCGYLPEEQHAAAPEILASVRDNLPHIAGWIDAADTSIKSRTWDNAKTTAHHGIIPTVVRADVSGLHPHVRAVYELIVRQYLAQFFPVHAYRETTVLAEVDGEGFAARGKTVTEPGWKAFYQEAAEEGQGSDQEVPSLTVGDAITFTALQRKDLRTKPPKHFTEGTLPIAMENIYRYITDEADRASLKEGDGIGTPATRGAIIEELKNRGFLINEGPWLVSTAAGRQILSLLPPDVQSPSLTASFQRQLKDIEKGERTIAQFVGEQVGFITSLVDLARSDLPVEEHHVCPACGGDMRRVRRKDGSGHFWSCSHWKEGCKSTADDIDGEPVYRTAA